MPALIATTETPIREVSTSEHHQAVFKVEIAAFDKGF